MTFEKLVQSQAEHHRVKKMMRIFHSKKTTRQERLSAFESVFFQEGRVSDKGLEFSMEFGHWDAYEHAFEKDNTLNLQFTSFMGKSIFHHFFSMPPHLVKKVLNKARQTLTEEAISDMLSQVDGTRRTPLTILCQKGTSELIIMVSSFFTPDNLAQKDIYGDTPLHKVSSRDDLALEIIPLLIDKGANPYAQDNGNYTPFLRACSVSLNNTRALFPFSKERLYQHSQPTYVSTDDGTSHEDDFGEITAKRLPAIEAEEEALTLFNEGDDLELMEGLEEFEITSIDSINKFGSNGLYAAVNAGRMDIVNFLLEKGYDVNAENKSGNSVLHAAVFKNDLPMVELLLSHGADINFRNSFGFSPFSLSARRYKDTKAIFQVFLQRDDIDWSIRSETGGSALEWLLTYMSGEEWANLPHEIKQKISRHQFCSTGPFEYAVKSSDSIEKMMDLQKYGIEPVSFQKVNNKQISKQNKLIEPIDDVHIKTLEENHYWDDSEPNYRPSSIAYAMRFGNEKTCVYILEYMKENNYHLSSEECVSIMSAAMSNERLWVLNLARKLVIDHCDESAFESHFQKTLFGVAPFKDLHSLSAFLKTAVQHKNKNVRLAQYERFLNIMEFSPDSYSILDWALTVSSGNSTDIQTVFLHHVFKNAPFDEQEDVFRQVLSRSKYPMSVFLAYHINMIDSGTSLCKVMKVLESHFKRKIDSKFIQETLNAERELLLLNRPDLNKAIDKIHYEHPFETQGLLYSMIRKMDIEGLSYLSTMGFDILAHDQSQPICYLQGHLKYMTTIDQQKIISVLLEKFSSDLLSITNKDLVQNKAPFYIHVNNQFLLRKIESHGFPLRFDNVEQGSVASSIFMDRKRMVNLAAFEPLVKNGDLWAKDKYGYPGVLQLFSKVGKTVKANIWLSKMLELMPNPETHEDWYVKNVSLPYWALSFGKIDAFHILKSKMGQLPISKDGENPLNVLIYDPQRRSGFYTDSFSVDVQIPSILKSFSDNGVDVFEKDHTGLDPLCSAILSQHILLATGLAKNGHPTSRKYNFDSLDQVGAIRNKEIPQSVKDSGIIGVMLSFLGLEGFQFKYNQNLISLIYDLDHNLIHDSLGEHSVLSYIEPGFLRTKIENNLLKADSDLHVEKNPIRNRRRI